MWTAFILYNHSLFARGLRELLREKDEVRVLGVEARGEEAFAHIRALKPDVVIVEAKKGESEPEILLSRFLREQCQARLVQLNLEDNTCLSDSGCRCTINSVEDLVRCLVRSVATQAKRTSQPDSYAKMDEEDHSSKEPKTCAR